MPSKLSAAYELIQKRNRKIAHSCRPAVYKDGRKVIAGDKYWEQAEELTDQITKLLAETHGYRRYYPGLPPEQISLFGADNGRL